MTDGLVGAWEIKEHRITLGGGIVLLALQVILVLFLLLVVYVLLVLFVLLVLHGLLVLLVLLKEQWWITPGGGD